MKHDKRAARFGAAYYGSEDDALMARLDAETQRSMSALHVLLRRIGIRSEHIEEQNKVLLRLAGMFA